MNEWLFYGLSLILILSALGVSLSAYPIRSALYLILSFLLTSILWVDLGAEFLALALLFIYVGAVMVLFLFIVFMLNSNKLDSIAFGKKMMVMMGLFIMLVYLFSKFQITGGFSFDMADNTRKLGLALYDDYWMAFEILGAILLCAMVSVLVMVEKRHSQVKKQNISAQMNRQKGDCLKWM